MSYFVLGADGQRYGPVDLATLNQWAQEGRVQANTVIVDVATGGDLLASQMPGLNLPAAPYSPPPSPYPRAGGGAYSPVSTGSTEATLAWVFGALTIVTCCAVLPAVGWYFANRAAALGNPQASGARVFNIVMLGLSIVGGLFYLLAMVMGVALGGVQ